MKATRSPSGLQATRERAPRAELNMATAVHAGAPTWKRALGIAASLVLLGALGGCVLSPETLPTPLPAALPTAQPSPTTPSAEALDPSGSELHLWHALTGEKEKTLRELAARFESENPYSIRVRVEFHNPLDREMRTAMAAGTPPDLLIASSEQIVQYALADAIAPLSDYIADPNQGFTETQQADLWPIALYTATLRDLSAQPLGIFFDAQIMVMFYNADWLKNLSAAGPPQAWDEFRRLCDEARDRKAGTWGYAHTADGSMWANWIAGLEGTLVDGRTGQATLDSPEAIAALSVLSDLRKDGCAYCQSTPGEPLADFSAQLLLFTFGSSADLPQFTKALLNPKTQKPLFKWDIAPMPYLTAEPAVNAQGSVMSIVRTTARQQLAAWLFIRWFLGPENDVQWSLATGALPLRKSSLETEEMQAYFELNPQFKTACQLLTYARTDPAVPNWGDIRALLAASSSAVCLGQAEPAEVLAAADLAADSRSAR